MHLCLHHRARKNYFYCTHAVQLRGDKLWSHYTFPPFHCLYNNPELVLVKSIPYVHLHPDTLQSGISLDEGYRSSVLGEDALQLHLPPEDHDEVSSDQRSSLLSFESFGSSYSPRLEQATTFESSPGETSNTCMYIMQLKRWSPCSDREYIQQISLTIQIFRAAYGIAFCVGPPTPVNCA